VGVLTDGSLAGMAGMAGDWTGTRLLSPMSGPSPVRDGTAGRLTGAVAAPSRTAWRAFPMLQFASLAIAPW